MEPMQWVKDIVGPSPLEKGKRYMHPEDGLIEVTGGSYWGNHGLSNFWYWRIIETGEIRSGYGDDWPEVK
jgi:hypothetical protein